MKKNIGILFPASRKMGVFQYGLGIAEGLINHFSDFDYTILHFSEESPKEFLKINSSAGVKFIALDNRPNNFLGKIKSLANILIGSPIFITNKKNRKILESNKMDLLIIPFPLLFGFENKVPYIVSIPDIMHKFYPKFPEYNFSARVKRDFVYGLSTKNAIFSVVDSEQGKEHLQRFYNVPAEKIKPIPYIPPGYVYDLKNMEAGEAENILKKYKLPDNFIFYPAQFWHHKNHLRLIRALQIIKEEKHIEVKLVLTGNPGANNENFKKVMDLVKEAKMESQIFHLGYVDDKEIVALYKKSTALVFPTLLEPTNIPPLEALVLGKPVLCSFFQENKKQVGNAGVFYDPFSERDMAEKIYQFWSSEELKKTLVEFAKEKSKEITVESHAKKWGAVVSEALK